ncbi:cupin domain-containing protein [bacterium]|nr:cupin domain-containing protein [bacterium]
MKELSLRTPDLEWKENHQYAAGANAKELLTDEKLGLSAIMLQLEPGWHMSEHAHIHTEIHYVIRGEYKSQGKTYGKGTFRVIPKETNHGPFSSEKGATILVLWINIEHRDSGSSETNE